VSARRLGTTWILVHQLDRSGVPIALLRMLRWARATASLDRVHVVAAHGGPLAPEVSAVASSVTVLAPAGRRSRATTLALAGERIGAGEVSALVADRWTGHRLRSLPAPDAVLVHGAGAWPLFSSLEHRVGAARVVLHLHELAVGFERSIPVAVRAAAIERPDAIASVCRPDAVVADHLGRRAADVLIVPGAVDDAAPPPAPPATGAEEVVAIGASGWRKGTDRFVALAHELQRSRPEVRCTWIGPAPPASWRGPAWATGPVRWVGEHPDPWTEVDAHAVVVIPSREDPLPLVALEAGHRGHGVVAARTGGLCSLLADGRGTLVDAGDLRALAGAVLRELDDPAAARARGAALRAHVQAQHRASSVGPRWLHLLVG
jgi:glycosyltransferase involved in cell wall biosynthesis